MSEAEQLLERLEQSDQRDRATGGFLAQPSAKTSSWTEPA